MASYIPNSTKGRLLGDNSQISTAIDMEADTIKAMLLTSSHTGDVDANVFISEISANEIGTTGSYTTGAGNGFSVTPTASTDDTNNRGAWDCTDLSATSATISAQYLAVYKWTGVAATSPVICVVDFGSVQTVTGGTFTITIPSAGLVTLS